MEPWVAVLLGFVGLGAAFVAVYRSGGSDRRADEAEENAEVKDAMHRAAADRKPADDRLSKHEF